MFRYQPPKSSVWGHLLRNMPAERERALLGRFLATAVAGHRFSSAQLSIHDSPRQVVQRYESLVGLISRNGRFDSLTHQQSELCLDQLVRDQAAGAGEADRVRLAQAFELSKWRIDGREVPTRSLLSMHYGELPCISTFFQFETVDEFQGIKRVLDEIGLCKLNEQHLKPIRARRK